MRLRSSVVFVCLMVLPPVIVLCSGPTHAAAASGTGGSPPTVSPAAASAALVPTAAPTGGASDAAAPPAREEVAAAAAAGGAGAPTPEPSATPTTPQKQEEIEFKTGSRLRYGLSVSLLQFSVRRSDSEPGRARDYTPNLEVIPPEIGFQFTFQPSTGPWRLKKADGTSFQLMSAGGMLLVRVDDVALAQGAIGIGATLNFFENTIGIGFGVDLYRGIPIAGATGVAGAGTAYTGLLAWAFSPQGEVTPENLFVVFSFGLDPIVKALSGELKP